MNDKVHDARKASLSYKQTKVTKLTTRRSPIAEEQKAKEERRNGQEGKRASQTEVRSHPLACARQWEAHIHVSIFPQ